MLQNRINDLYLELEVTTNPNRCQAIMKEIEELELDLAVYGEELVF